MKKTYSTTIIVGLIFLSLLSCKKAQKVDNNIITKIQDKPKPQSKVQSLEEFKAEKEVAWLGKSYFITIVRKSNKDLNRVIDEYGNTYFDNEILVEIDRADGTNFFKQTFTKQDFSQFINTEATQSNALLGIMFDRVDGNTLYFGASIGSPDKNNDEFIPLNIKITNMGEVKIELSNAADTDFVDESGE